MSRATFSRAGEKISRAINWWAERDVIGTARRGTRPSQAAAAESSRDVSEATCDAAQSPERLCHGQPPADRYNAIAATATPVVDGVQHLPPASSFPHSIASSTSIPYLQRNVNYPASTGPRSKFVL